MKKVSIAMPTKNAGAIFLKTLEGLKRQNYGVEPELIVIDSGSTDGTLELAQRYGARIISIAPKEFDHGLTRNRALENASGEIVILMSQDAVPGDPNLISNFVAAFDDEKVAGAYARQLPREDADVLTRRNLNNWLTGRSKQETKWIKDWQTYKDMTPMERYYFCSFDNVCSAIRKNVWQSLPFNANDFGEDIDWAQRALEAGWKIAYCPDAYVIHSHERSFQYEYARNVLCHKKLYRQFGIAAVPTWKQIAVSTLVSTLLDWKYVIRNEGRMIELISMIIRIPFINFASVYGQYKGLKAGLAREES